VPSRDHVAQGGGINRRAGCEAGGFRFGGSLAAGARGRTPKSRCPVSRLFGSGGAVAGHEPMRAKRTRAAEGDGIDCPPPTRPQAGARGFSSPRPSRGRLPAPRARLTAAGRGVPSRERAEQDARGEDDSGEWASRVLQRPHGPIARFARRNRPPRHAAENRRARWSVRRVAPRALTGAERAFDVGETRRAIARIAEEGARGEMPAVYGPFGFGRVTTPWRARGPIA